MATILIVSGILVYCFFIIACKLRAFKQGKYCSCGCAGCVRKGDCTARKDLEKAYKK